VEEIRFTDRSGLRGIDPPDGEAVYGAVVFTHVTPDRLPPASPEALTIDVDMPVDVTPSEAWARAREILAGLDVATCHVRIGRPAHRWVSTTVVSIEATLNPTGAA